MDFVVIFLFSVLLPRETVHACSLEILKVVLDRALGWASGRCLCPWKGVGAVWS